MLCFLSERVEPAGMSDCCNIFLFKIGFIMLLQCLYGNCWADDELENKGS